MRHADLKGYAYSRDDVDARGLANQYAQILGQIFTHEMKPMEVEILVAEIGEEPGREQLFHILYDGTVDDENLYSVLGGEAETISERLAEFFDSDLPIAPALALCRWTPWPDRSGPLAPTIWKWPSWTGASAGAASGGWRWPRSAPCWATPRPNPNRIPNRIPNPRPRADGEPAE